MRELVLFCFNVALSGGEEEGGGGAYVVFMLSGKLLCILINGNCKTTQSKD